MKTESKISLKKAEFKDIPSFIEIEKSAPSKIYSSMITEEEWKDELSNKDATVYAIIKDGRIIGDTSYIIKNSNTAYISGLCIDSKFRGQGIGKESMCIMLEELKDFKRIELVTHPDNINAIKLYESLGFKIESRKENYFGDGKPRIVMVLEKQ